MYNYTRPFCQAPCNGNTLYILAATVYDENKQDIAIDTFLAVESLFNEVFSRHWSIEHVFLQKIPMQEMKLIIFEMEKVYLQGKCKHLITMRVVLRLFFFQNWVDRYPLF